MKDFQLKITRNNEGKDGNNGFKVIEVNVSNPTESLYAVVTPIKKQQEKYLENLLSGNNTYERWLYLKEILFFKTLLPLQVNFAKNLRANTLK